MNSSTRNKALCRGILLGILLFFSVSLFAQNTYIISGTVLDSSTGELLEGASVIDVQSGRGTISDGKGRYRLRSRKPQITLQIGYLGYAAVDTIINLSSDQEIDFYLEQTTVEYDEVRVTAETEPDFVSSVRMGGFVLDAAEINSLPKLLGEADPIRFLQLTPGIQSSSEGGVGFYVRGGSVDQNLVLFDDATIYNPGHLLGFVSVFNPDIIDEVSLLKSGIPSRYGGRLSSVVRVNPDQGRSDSLRIRGQLGLVASRITVNRSFHDDRGSFILSGRRASIDLFVKPVIFPILAEENLFLQESSYNFYDLSGKISYKIGNRDHLSISAFYGQDKYGLSRTERIAGTSMYWGNAILTAKWNHVFSDQLVLRTTASRTAYHFDLAGALSEYMFSLVSAVDDYSLKSNLDYFTDSHKLSFGYEIKQHQFTPNDIDAKAGGLLLNFLNYNQLHAREGGVYAEDEFNVNERIAISAGLRYSFFSHLGPYQEYIYDEASLLQDSVLYARGERLAYYHHLEPRVSARYQLNPHASLKASYMHMAQYIHLATSSAVSLPTDIWLPSSMDIQPQFGDQLSAGYFADRQNGQYEYSIELYYKHMRNQIEFLRGVLSSSIGLTLTDNLITGTGQSYGAEFFVRKKTGTLTGWVGYTISRSIRKFELINDGRIYPAKNDRRHDVSLAAIYKLNDKWSLSSVFVYVSGNAFTLPIGRYIIQGNLVNEYGRVNNYRMPAYHRLDFSATHTQKTKRGNISTWDFSVYNVYSRANPFYIYFETTGDLERYRLDVEPVIVSLFPIVPTISYRFEF
ncbi:TonB-dependent receptor domain-containing protein [Bacteroidota bacterium]